MKSDNETFHEHDRLLFMFRDYSSLEYSKMNFSGVPAIYVPDMAFIMGPQTPNSSPVVDVLFLLRSDKEKVVKSEDKIAALELLQDNNVTYEDWDFPVLGYPTSYLSDNVTVVYDYTKILPKQLTHLVHNNRHAFMGLATQLGNTLLSRGRVVITDRLHASIMATLLGKPVIYLDNNYKKITQVRGALAKEFKECSDANLHAKNAKTLVDAANLALKILDGSLIM